MNQEYTFFSQGTSDPILYHMPTIKKLEQEMATHSSIPGLEDSMNENLVGYSTKGHKESDTTEQLKK